MDQTQLTQATIRPKYNDIKREAMSVSLSSLIGPEITQNYLDSVKDDDLILHFVSFKLLHENLTTKDLSKKESFMFWVCWVRFNNTQEFQNDPIDFGDQQQINPSMAIIRHLTRCHFTGKLMNYSEYVFKQTKAKAEWWHFIGVSAVTLLIAYCSLLLFLLKLI